MSCVQPPLTAGAWIDSFARASAFNLAVVAVYFALGLAIYLPLESKFCEPEPNSTLPAPPAQRSAHDPYGSDRCVWTVVDTLYFCVATMSTVGQPFLEPTRRETEAFTLCYFIVGVLVVWKRMRQVVGWLPYTFRWTLLRLVHYLSGRRSGWLSSRFRSYVAQPLNSIYVRHIDKFLDMVFMLEVMRCYHSKSVARTHLTAHSQPPARFQPPARTSHALRPHFALPPASSQYMRAYKWEEKFERGQVSHSET